MTNLFHIPEKLPLAAPELVHTLLSGAEGLRVERIVSAGHTSPEGFWYDQADDEWVAVLEGSARVLFENGEEATLARGETLFIPSQTRHRVTHTSTPCIWLAIFAKSLTPTP